jgi:hypothetical protein
MKFIDEPVLITWSSLISFIFLSTYFTEFLLTLSFELTRLIILSSFSYFGIVLIYY